MSPPTRAKALEKMSAFGVKIGFPDRWIDYAPLGIAVGDHMGNVLRARAFEFKRRVCGAGRRQGVWLGWRWVLRGAPHPNRPLTALSASALHPAPYSKN